MITISLNHTNDPCCNCGSVISTGIIQIPGTSPVILCDNCRENIYRESKFRLRKNKKFLHSWQEYDVIIKKRDNEFIYGFTWDTGDETSESFRGQYFKDYLTLEDLSKPDALLRLSEHNCDAYVIDSKNTITTLKEMIELFVDRPSTKCIASRLISEQSDLPFELRKKIELKAKFANLTNETTCNSVLSESDVHKIAKLMNPGTFFIFTLADSK